MDSIIFIINKTYDLMQTRLIFGQFSFSIFSVYICFGGLALAAYFFGRLFDR